MAFGRHRQIQETINSTTKEKVKEVIVNGKKDPIIEAIEKTFPEAVITEIEKEEIKKEPIKRVYTKEQKARKVAKRKEARKVYNNIALSGNSVVCKDFRAIIKKKGQTINVVLNQIIHEWNTKNYNL